MTPGPKGSPRPKEPSKPKIATPKPVMQKPAKPKLAKPKPAKPRLASPKPAMTETTRSSSARIKPAPPKPPILEPTILEPAILEPTISEPTAFKPVTPRTAMLKLAMPEPTTSELTASLLEGHSGAQGRPRKYPAVGTPAGVDKMTPQELKRLRTSQESAAYYIRKKRIAEEVAKRVEAGEDPAAAKEAVVVELAPAKKEKQRPAAGTNNTTTETGTSTSRPVRKRKRKASLQTEEAEEENRAPGETAENIIDSSIDLFGGTTQINHGVTAIAADLPDLLLTAASRRLETAVEMATLEDPSTHSSDITPRPPKKRKKPLKMKESSINTDLMPQTIIVAPATNIRDPKLAGYQALAQNIARINCGIVVGPHAFRKAGIGRPRKARLAIIKMSRLNELPFFEKDREPSIEAPKVADKKIPAPPCPDNSPNPTASARPSMPAAGVQQPVDQPTVIGSTYVSPYDSVLDEISPRPDSDYVSSHMPKTGEKRKRTRSSTLETGSSGPRRGFFGKLPVTNASNTKRRSVVSPPRKRFQSPVTQFTSTLEGQTVPEHVAEEIVVAAQRETSPSQSLIHNLVQKDTDHERSNVEPMQDAKQTAPASKRNADSEPMSIDPAHDCSSDSQSTVTDPDLVEEIREPELASPVDMTSLRVDQLTVECSTALLGDTNPADRTPGDGDLFNTHFDLKGGNAKWPGTVTNLGDRSPVENQLVGELHKTSAPIAADMYSRVMGGFEVPSPRPYEEQTDDQIALNGDSCQTEQATTDLDVIEINSYTKEIGLSGEQNEMSDPSSMDVPPEISTGISDASGLPLKEQQPHDSPAQRSGPDVQLQSSAELLDDGSAARRNTPLSLLGNADDQQVDVESQFDPVDGLPRIIHVHDADEDSSVKSTPKEKSSRVITRLTPNSGSIGNLRQKIIMEIVETCGGVFPGDKELWYPFTTAWLQRMPPGTGKPDNRTLGTAKKALIGSGKLRQLRFTFLNKHGVMVEKGMITAKDVHSNAPTVKNLQRKMIEQDPWLYVPEEAAVAEDLRRSHATAVVFGTNRTTSQLEVDEETQVKLQYVPAYIRRAAINKEAAAAKRRAAAVKRKMQEDRELTTDEKYRARGKELRKLLGVPDFAINGYRSAEVIMESEKDGISQFKAFEGASPPPVRRPGRSFGSHTNPNRPKVQRLARLGGPFQPRPLRSILPRPSSQLLDESAEAGPLLAAHRLMVKSTAAAEQVARDYSHDTSLRPRQRKDYAAINRGQIRPPEELRFEIWTPEHPTFHEKQRFIKPLALDSTFDRTPSPDFELLRPLTPQGRSKPRFSLARNTEFWHPQLDTSYEWQQVSTLMDPDHCFHAATGTYSVTFSVLRNVRLGLDNITKGQGKNRKAALPDIPASNSSLPFKHYVPDQYRPLPGSKSLFHSEIDDMLLMELDAPNLEPYVSDGLRFINYVMPHPHYVAERPERSGTKRSRHAKGLSARPIGAHKNASRSAKSKLIVLKLATHHLASVANRPSVPTLVRPGSRTRHDADGRPLRRVRAPGGERLSKYMSMTMEKHLMTAVVVIRTLTGGLDGNLDWNLVASLFQPTYSAAFVHNRWASLRVKYRVQIDKMEMDFQNLFASAYEDNLIPALDFDNVEGYDWAWLVDWTKKHLEFPSPHVLPDLPTDRAQLDKHYDMRETKEPDLSEYFFSLDPTHTCVRRQARMQRKPMTVPLPPKSRNPPNSDLQLLEVAKTWVRANVITLESNYNPTLAHQKLVSLPVSSISTALQSLHSDRTIAQVGKGRLVPGRNYSLSDLFFTRLRSSLPVPQIQRAAQYKLALDRSFADHGKAEVSYHAEDGDILALTNLVAHRRVNLVPRNPPMKKFGFVDGDYKTRFMDTSRLTFAVDIFPTDTYTPGLPALPPHPVPLTTDPNDPGSKVPVWIDIHGNFVREMWDLALAAVLGLVVLRPGMGAGALAEAVAPCLGVWEVEWLLEWLVEAGVAGWVDGGRGCRGVKVGEGWWGVVGRVGMVSGNGEQGGGGQGEGEGEGVGGGLRS